MSKIRSLSTREQCRDKIAIFYGSRDNYMHGLNETIVNSIDVISNNYDSGEITVFLHANKKKITVKDTGTGIPLLGESDGQPNYVLLLETLFAGSNYDNVAEGKETGGLNGVGLCVLNHTSSFFECTSYRDGKMTTINYTDGGNRRGLITEPCSSDLHGTTITFELDNTVYPVTEFNPDDIKNILEYYSASSEKIKFAFYYMNEEYFYHYDSISDFYYDKLENKITCNKEIELNNAESIDTTSIVYVDKSAVGSTETETMTTEKTTVSFILSTGNDNMHISFLNRIHLKEHGTIHDGIVRGFRSWFNKYCKDNKKFPKGITSFLVSDIEDSINYVCNVRSTNVEYANQTKFSTNKTLYKTILEKMVKNRLDAELIENPENIKSMASHLLLVQESNKKAETAKKKLKQALESNSTSKFKKPEKLIDCRYKGEQAELYICEGDSAGTSITLARENADYQAVYKLRGKTLNCLKETTEAALNNEVIQNLIKILGCGIEVTDKKFKEFDGFDIKKLKYGKIFIATDQDVDGFQIACLLLTFFKKYMPQLIIENRVCIVETPLFEIRYTDNTYKYLYSDQELEDFYKTKQTKKYDVHRNKGLGEVNAEVLNESAMNPDTRTIKVVTVSDVEQMNEQFKIWLEKDVAYRKEEIAKNMDKAVL